MKYRAILIALFAASLLSFNHVLSEQQKWSSFNYSVMRLIANGPYHGGGTGFQIETKEGKKFVVTNDHICRVAGPDKELMAIPLGGPVQVLKVLAVSQVADICLLSPAVDVPPLHLGDQDFKKGDKGIVIGHPQLYGLKRTEGRIFGFFPALEVMDFYIVDRQTEAKCSGPRRHAETVFFGLIKICIAVSPAQETNIPIKPGNSGSPAFGTDGLVRGVIFAGSEKDKRSFIIPLGFLKALIADASSK